MTIPRLLPPETGRVAAPLLAARGLRAFGDGFVAVLLPIHLLQRGFSPFEVGLISSVTLLGSAALTLLVGLYGHRVSGRKLLMLSCLLTAATGLGFAFLDELWPLLIVAFLGTLNPGAGDVSVFVPLEQRGLAEATPARHRTGLFARYSLIGGLAGALGSLAAGAPELFAGAGAGSDAAWRAMLMLYAALGLACLPLYWPVRDAAPSPERKTPPLGPSRGLVLKLSALFSVDAFAGGFAVQSIVVLWLHERFGFGAADAGVFFFWAGLVMSGSYLVAVPVARRIGLINTMVFTHIPANLFLIGAAFAPTLWLALAFLLLRAALAQMDVPARTSYVMGMVEPEERAAAAAMTAVPRSLAAALSPMLAGGLIAALPFLPFLLCGGLKIGYDLALWAGFRKLKPPEER
ncbi:MAG: MFS transporter [Alphaproteobacteria bacterium]